MMITDLKVHGYWISTEGVPLAFSSIPYDDNTSEGYNGSYFTFLGFMTL
jgi:hypothetical protein